MIQNLEQQEALVKQLEENFKDIDLPDYQGYLEQGGRVRVTELYLTNRKINDDQLNFILKAFPNLQVISIKRCYSFKQIHFQACPKLKVVKLKDTPITIISLNSLCKLTNLEELKLTMCDNLKEIRLDGCNKLKILTLGCKNLTNQSIKNISLSCPNIQKFSLKQQVSTQSIVIQNWQNLKYLKINYSGINCKNFQLKSCPLLEELQMEGQGFKHIKIQDVKLKKLDLYCLSNIVKIDLNCLSQLIKLRALCENLQQLNITSCDNIVDLDLSKTLLSNQKVKSLCQSLPKIQKLIVYSCKNINQLAFKSETLKYICLRQTSIDDLHLQQLILLPALQIINADNCDNIKNIRIHNNNTLKQLHFAHSSLIQIQLIDLPQLNLVSISCSLNFNNIKVQNCPKIKKIHASNTPINHVQVQQILSQTPQLQQIYLNLCKNIQKFQLENHNKIKIIYLQQTLLNRISIKNLAALDNLSIKKCRDIQYFEITGCNQIKKLDLLWNCIKKLKIYSLINLQQLYISEVFQQIQLLNLPKLNYISLSESNVNDLQLSQILNSTPSLQKINLQNCKHIKDVKLQNNNSLKYLYFDQSSIQKCQIKSYTQLIQLSLQNCKYLKMIKLQQCQKLKYLNLINTPTIIETQIPDISENLPDLKITLFQLPQLDDSDSDSD